LVSYYIIGSSSLAVGLLVALCFENFSAVLPVMAEIIITSTTFNNPGAGATALEKHVNIIIINTVKNPVNVITRLDEISPL